jgi:5-methylcytosine-specific restriction endonuclease McrA
MPFTRPPGDARGVDRFMTSKARKAAIVRAVKKRRKKVREMAISHKGGKCQSCGYNRCLDALEFHHLLKDEKSFGISAKGYTRSWKAIEKELEKCIMLCANCHRELHAGLLGEKDISLFE